MLIRQNITTEEYFKLPYASNSNIKEAYKMFTASENAEIDTTKSFAFGSAFDALTTEQSEFSTEKLTDKEVSLLMPMRRLLEANMIYSACFKNADKQAVFIDKEFEIDLDGMNVVIPAKCKFDLWSNMLNFGGDIKSTVAASQTAFEKAAKMFKYNMQAAWYMDITRSNRFIIIGISKTKYKTFDIQIKRGDNAYIRGKKDYLFYARYWWMVNR